MIVYKAHSSPIPSFGKNKNVYFVKQDNNMRRCSMDEEKKVVQLVEKKGEEKDEYTPNKCLADCEDVFSDCVVIGWTKEGTLAFRTSENVSTQEMHWLLSLTKSYVIQQMSGG
jgi:hypothetical protein